MENNGKLKKYKSMSYKLTPMAKNSFKIQIMDSYMDEIFSDSFDGLEIDAEEHAIELIDDSIRFQKMVKPKLRMDKDIRQL